jgi:hypothetical protein
MGWAGLRARYRLLRELDLFLWTTGGLTLLGIALVLVVPRPWIAGLDYWGHGLLGVWMFSLFLWFLRITDLERKARSSRDVGRLRPGRLGNRKRLPTPPPLPRELGQNRR